MRLAIFGIQWTEINSPSPRLVQSDRLRKEFARFFKFAVVRHHIGGRTTRVPSVLHRTSEARRDRLWRFLIDFGRTAPSQMAKLTLAK